MVDTPVDPALHPSMEGLDWAWEAEPLDLVTG